MDQTRGNKKLTWYTACEGGACVQVAVDNHSILIGNSRRPDGPVLEYTPDEWHEFVGGIKKGAFDHLLK
jgi:hypothetical protein